MATIEFTAQEKSVLVEKLKSYFHDELDQEIGQFDAEFLLDFMSKEIGAYHYNKGLKDAQDAFVSRMDVIVDTIYELEILRNFQGNSSCLNMR